MGYYNGNGVVVGGGESVNVLESFVFYGAHNVYQKDVSNVRSFNGVSLATAQNSHGDCNMSVNQFTWGSCWHYTPNAKGTKKEVSYSRIADSNLYELQETNHVIQAKLDSQGWVS